MKAYPVHFGVHPSSADSHLALFRCHVVFHRVAIAVRQFVNPIPSWGALGSLGRFHFLVVICVQVFCTNASFHYTWVKAT